MISTAKISAASSYALNTSGIGAGPNANESSTSTGATNNPIWALDPIAMLTARSILFLTATDDRDVVLRGVADDRDDERADEELRQPDRLRRVLDRAGEQLAHHADQHGGREQRHDRSPQRPQRPARLLPVTGREQVPVGPQREHEPGRVDRDHHDADRDREVLDLSAEGMARLPDDR